MNFSFYQLNSLNKKSVLTCEKATINATTNIMIANGDVNIKIGDTTISTQQLIWDKNRKVRYFEDRQRKHDNVDLIYSDYKVINIYDADTTSFTSFRCTSDFGKDRVINGKTFKSPIVLTTFSSDAIISVPLKEN